MWRLSAKRVLPRGSSSSSSSSSSRNSCSAARVAVVGRSRGVSVLSSTTTAANTTCGTSSIRSGRVRCYHATRIYPQKTGKDVGAPAASSWDLGGGGGDDDDIDDETLDRLAMIDADPNDPDDIPDLLDHRFRSLDDDDIDDIDEEKNDEEERENYRIQQEDINDELDQRKGRPWRDPWEITEDQWMASDTGPDSIPDWSPSFVSRIAQERLRVLSAEDGTGIPTLESLAAMTLPAADPKLHPARATKTYAAYRKSQHARAVRECVERLAGDRVAALLKTAAGTGTPSNSNDSNSDSNSNNNNNSEAWRDRQDAVDALFEAMQDEAKNDEAMDILSKHPDFPRWVERGLEDYLRDAQKAHASGSSSSSSGGDAPAETGDEEVAATEETSETATATFTASDSSSSSWKEGTPVFMDCYDPSEAGTDGSKEGPMVPSILKPLAPHRHGGPGKMVEEWELAAHPSTKRILLRECTSRIAGHLVNNNNNNNNNDANAASKIYVHGKRGTGKSAVLASIVASARRSGCIVVYLPDGDRLRKNGFFVTPSTHPDRKGTFDLQDLSREALIQLGDSHASDLEGMVADKETLSRFFKDTQLQKVEEHLSEQEQASTTENGVALTDLIAYAKDNKKHAPMCYSAVLHHLLYVYTPTTDTKKVVLVMDEFNCLFDHGQYFHMSYDEHVRNAIPCDKINLFEPILAAMNLTTLSAEHEEDQNNNSNNNSDEASTTDNHSTPPVLRASVVVGTTESHAVRRDTTDALTECAQRRSAASNAGSTGDFHVVEVPRFSSLEADHVLANFEAIGIGKLRLDRGDTLMDSQEVEFLKMASGSVGQKLLDVSIL